jgi:hypothetical protein
MVTVAAPVAVVNFTQIPLMIPRKLPFTLWKVGRYWPRSWAWTDPTVSPAMAAVGGATGATVER